MAQTAAVETDLPTDEDFEALLEESYGTGEAMEGRVVKGTIIAHHEHGVGAGIPGASTTRSE